MAKVKKAVPAVADQIKPGDRVLIGAPGVSMPGDWWIVVVLWVCREEFAGEHEAPSGGAVRQFFPMNYVRAVGEHAFLRDFQDAARVRVADQRTKVDALTRDLGDARDAVWALLDEIAARPGALGNG